MKRRLLIAALWLSWLPGLLAAALAQESASTPAADASAPPAAESRPALAERYRTRDADGDGRMSRDEYVRPNLGTEWEPAAREESVRNDLDGDGFFTPVEFALSPAAQATPEEVVTMLDADEDGSLSRDEFARRHPPNQAFDARVGFEGADADGDGRVSPDEFRQAEAEAGTGTLGQFRSRDLDGDDRLTPEEYVRPNLGGPFEAPARDEAARFDADGDGHLSLLEFANTPPGKATPAVAFGLLDADGDGRLGLEELARRHPAVPPEVARLAFRHFDADGDGWAARAEFVAASAEPGAEFAARFAFADADRDGRLSRAEYVRPHLGGPWERSATDESVSHDADGDGFLTPAEYALSPSAAASPALRFAATDLDGDGAVTRQELFRATPAAARPGVAATYLRSDADGDGRLTLAESAGPGRAVEDPVADLAAAAVEAFRSLLREHDRDGDGALAGGEWPASRVAELVRGPRGDPQANWDGDGDGRVTEAEGRSVLEVAWGVRRPGGQPLRRQTGHVLNWAYPRGLDRDGDDRVARAEFVEVHHLGRERSAELFKELDPDGDGRSTFDEFFAGPLFLHDAVWDFARNDADFDGKITQAELDAAAQPWQKSMARFLIRAFDDDRDGALGFREFRLTPFANPVAEWYAPRDDADHDGRLSWEEFYPERPPLLAGLWREYFVRFDRDRDGLLSPDELEYRVDLAKAPPDAAFAMQDRDGDGRVTFAEVFSEPKPDGGDARRLQEYQLRLMRAEESFLAGDADGDGAIGLAEFRDARKNAAAAAVLGPAPAAEETDGTNWLMVGFVTLDAVVLLGVGFWFFRGSRSRG